MSSAESGNRCPALLKHISIEAMAVAAEALNVPFHDIISNQRSRARVSFARQVAMYLAHVVGQMTLGEISAVFERDRTTVGYACHIIEDRRDAPIFDREIADLETQFRTRLAALFARESAFAARSALDDGRIMRRAHLRRRTNSE